MFSIEYRFNLGDAAAFTMDHNCNRFERESRERAERHREISAYMISIHVVHRSGQYREVYTHLQRHASRDPNQPILHSQRPAALGTSLLVRWLYRKDQRSKIERKCQNCWVHSCKSKHEIKLQQHNNTTTQRLVKQKTTTSATKHPHEKAMLPPLGCLGSGTEDCSPTWELG